MHMGGHRFAAHSCGQPGEVGHVLHPAAVFALRKAAIPFQDAAPRTWNDLLRRGPPRLDIVVTLDERTIATQPIWPGQPIAALWSFEDAAAVANPDAANEAAMRILFGLQRRLELLINLPLHQGDPIALRSDLRELGRMF
mgnify:CR=1 FL=1